MKRIERTIGAAVLALALTCGSLPAFPQLALADGEVVAEGSEGAEGTQEKKDLKGLQISKDGFAWFYGQLSKNEKVYYDALKKAEDLTKFAKEEAPKAEEGAATAEEGAATEEKGLVLNVAGTYTLSGLTREEIDQGTYKNREDYKKLEKTIQGEVARAMMAYGYDYPQVFWLDGAEVKTKLSFAETENGWKLSVDQVTLILKEAYKDARKDIPDVEKALDKAVFEARALLWEGAGYTDTVRVVHNYVLQLGSYVKENPEEDMSEEELILEEEFFLEEEEVLEDEIILDEELDPESAAEAAAAEAAKADEKKPKKEQGQYKTIAGILLEKYQHEATAEGYAKLMKVLLDRMNNLVLNNVLVSGTTSDEVSGTTPGEKKEPTKHMWNLVQMKDQNWYLADAYLDDQETPAEVYVAVEATEPAHKDGVTVEEEHKSSGVLIKDFPAFKYPPLFGSKEAEEIKPEEPEEHVHTFSEWKTDWEATCTAEGQMSRTCTVCGEVETEVIPMKDHMWSDWEVTKEATCGEAGERARFCLVGGEVETEALPALEHAWGEWISDENATCTEDGTESHTCANCGETETRTAEGSALGHAWSEEWTIDQEATCTEDGMKSRHCERCGEVSEMEVIPATGHSFGEWTVSKEATCQEAGEQIRVCSACDTVETEVIPQKGHVWSDWEVTREATCGEAGERARFCLEGGEVETEVLPALEHAWGEWTSDENATCTEDGTESRTCANCGATETRTAEGSALGHAWSEEWTIDKEATCTEEGMRSRHCERCGEVSEMEVIPATGHSFGEWTVSKEATCQEAGEQIRVCSACDTVETEVIPQKDHVWSDWEVTREATCGEAGERARFCSVGGEVETEVLPALEHAWGEWNSDENATCTEDGTESRTCANCGHKETRTAEGSALGHAWSAEWTIDKEATCAEEGMRSHHCERCTEVSDMEVIPAKGHSFGEWTVTKEATCQEAGEQIRVCSVCDTVETEVLPQKEHAWGEWTVTKEATCREAGERTRTCSVGGEVETEAIPTLEHAWSEWTVTKEATCEDAGERSRVCSAGGETETEALPALGHKWRDWISDENATCTDDGTESRTCSVCQKTETRVKENSALGHDFSLEFTVDIPATTETEGVKSRHCIRCTERTDLTVIPVLSGTVITEVISDQAAGASSETDLKAVLDLVLSEDEIALKKTGVPVALRLNVSVITSLPGSDYSNIISAVNNAEKTYRVGEYLNIELLKTVDTTTTVVKTTETPIRLTVTIPEGMRKSANARNQRIFEMLRVHEGQTDFLPDLDEAEETITFETDKFSTYVLVYREESTAEPVIPVTEPPATEPPVTEPPTTEAPVTVAPTTEAPVTVAPTTEAPVTVAPTTEGNVGRETTKAAPATEPPTSGGGARTGDDSPILLYAVLAIVAFLILIILILTLAGRKRSKRR